VPKRFAISSTLKRTAITLVEVVAGTALLGTLLVAVLIADSKFERQSRRTKLHNEACVIANELLDSWWTDRKSFPRNDSGTVPHKHRWRWETKTISSVTNDGSIDTIGETVTLLLFFCPSDASKHATDPLIRIDVLLSEPLE
jgi:hypothetical protein